MLPDMSMTGRKAIVCRLDNNHFHEHSDVASAQREAERLARSVGGEFVVYVPLISVKKDDIKIERIAHLDSQDEYPF
jgi:hypothetical protein